MKPISFWVIALVFTGFFNVVNAQKSALSDSTLALYYQDEIAVGEFDSELFTKLESINTGHPAQIFMLCSEYINKRQMNDAAVCFFVGRNRFRIYNSTNPNHEPSGDGALAGSFAYIYGTAVQKHLDKNLDNFAAVLQTSGEWYRDNKHIYFEDSRYDSLYQLQIDGLLKNAEELRDKPEIYIRKLEYDPSLKYAGRLNQILLLDSLAEYAEVLDFDDTIIMDSVMKFKSSMQDENEYYASKRLMLDSKKSKDTLFPCEIATYEGIYRVTIDNAIGYYHELFSDYLLYENGYCWESIIIQYLHKTDNDVLLFVDFDSENSTFVLYADDEYFQMEAVKAIRELCSDETKFRDFLRNLDRNLLDC